MNHNAGAQTKSNRTGKPKLDDAETIILMAAAKREDGVAVPVPDSISAPADQIARKIKRLIKLSFLQEVTAKLEDGLWRKSADHRHLTLKITPLAFEVLGLDIPDSMKPTETEQLERTTEPAASSPAPKKTSKASASRGKVKKAAQNKPAKVSREPKKAKQRRTSKTETILSLLERAKGTSLDEIMKATGWQAHSVRGFLSAVVKKKLRLKLMSEENDEGLRRYRIKPRAKA